MYDCHHLHHLTLDNTKLKEDNWKKNSVCIFDFKYLYNVHKQIINEEK